MSKRRPWQLPKLLEANRNALTVYGALRWLAGDARQLFTTRASIRTVCGLSPDTISLAMTALAKAGWLHVNYGRQGNRTWYRLTFPVPGFFPVPGKRRHREGSGDRKKAVQGTAPCTPKKAAHPQGGIGTVPPESRPAVRGDSVPPIPGPASRHPALRAEEEDSGPEIAIVDLLKGMLNDDGQNTA